MEEIARKRMLQAREAFRMRGPDRILAAHVLLSELEPTVEDPRFHVEVLLFLAQVLCWRGQRAAPSAKWALLQNAVEVADKAERVFSTDLGAVGDVDHGKDLLGAIRYYRALAHGIRSGYGQWTRIREAIDARNGATAAYQANPRVDGYGPSRLLGKLHYNLPVALGGSYGEALWNLHEALEKAPEYACNHVEYAMALGKNNQRGEAHGVLDALLSKDPATFNPDRAPETIEEFADARALRHELE